MGGAEAKIQLFQNMVTLHYVIKGNDTCINMVANIVPIDPLPGPWGWSHNVKIQLFQNTVKLHIKLKKMTNAATCKHIILTLHTPSTQIDLNP